ncbi:MAG: hypothetical protein K2Q26_04855 [Bdellovibrionales bacterium]|nr:hypothetical protein [Bdellovibrionales bacterium]
MKIFLIGLLFPTLAFAIEGRFVFSGEVQSPSIIRHEVVYPGTEAGQARIAELMNLSYECKSALQFVKCTRVVDEEIPDVVKNYQPRFSEITFGTLKSYNPIYQGEDYVQYQADQEVFTPEKSYAPVKYTETADFTKVLVGDIQKGDFLGFFVEDNSIFHTTNFNVTESKWVFRTYGLEVKYTRQ